MLGAGGQAPPPARNFSVQRRDENSSLAIDVSEIEANRFAAELLIPYDFIMADLADYSIDIEEERLIEGLAKKYAVSAQAMTFRLNNLLGL
jgi:Zn-dependent peptidase ImmA (M78 family)